MKHWNPGREPVAIKGSKIRRSPAQVSLIRREPPPVAKKVIARSDTEETWFGVAGVLTVAAAVVVLILAVSYFTFFKTDDAAQARFGQCYNSEAGNCVVDGDTAFIAGERVQIAGMVAPRIRDGQCDDEKSLGIGAAMRLADVLNSGPVTLGAPFQDELGRTVRTVKAGGKDVGETLVREKLARRVDSSRKFC